MTGRLGLTDVMPVVSGGRYPARAVVGEAVPIAATVFGEGHALVAATVAWRGPEAARGEAYRMVPGAAGTDRWHAVVVPAVQGRWSFVVEAWRDPLSTWQHDVETKLDAGQGLADLANDMEDGARLLTRALRGLPRERRPIVTAAIAALRDDGRELAARIGPSLAPDLVALLQRFPVRELLTRSRRYELWVDRERALYGAWYELFPRSTGGVDAAGKPVHGTFLTTAERLPDIAAMGFDIVYLPPVHPIGVVNRKGANNSLVAAADDVGSPWAIGSDEGGHDAIHPRLGTEADFCALVASTNELGMEIALDLALQCAPDHPWAAEHPEWFNVRPDGTIAHAENPPKKYQDIYPLNFDVDPDGLSAEVLRVVQHWIGLGVRIFRVDNPHTKPLNFWNWLIGQVKKTDPDVLFLAEAFTRPAMMQELARIGFTQSYSYFTWRTEKAELEEYLTELVDSAHFMRPNFFVNTPDILHASLQQGGPPMFKIRAILASMLMPAWGVYSGYELFEHVALRAGSEEYLDSEKYQLRPRDFDAAEREGRSLAPYLTTLNQIRRRHPALHRLRNLRFHAADNDAITAFSKRDDDSGDTVLVVCTLDPHNVRESITTLDLAELGISTPEWFTVHDELGGESYQWGRSNYVRLDPHVEPAHVFRVEGQDW